MLGVVSGEPVPTVLPAVASSYQVKVPALAVAANETVPVSQREPGVVPEIEGIVFTVAITPVLEPVVHPLSVAST